MVDYRVDGQLIDDVNHGDKHAFDVLMERYQPKIGRVVARYAKDPSDVLDITQEVFIKAYQGIHNFRGESAFYTWLYRIAVNTAKNHVMTQKHRLVSPVFPIDELGDYRTFLRNTIAEQDTPENLMIRDEMEEAIFKVLQRLPKDVLMALILRERDRFSYKKIAQKMKCRLGTVKSRLARGREAIDKSVHVFLQHD